MQPEPNQYPSLREEGNMAALCIVRTRLNGKPYGAFIAEENEIMRFYGILTEFFQKNRESMAQIIVTDDYNRETFFLMLMDGKLMHLETGEIVFIDDVISAAFHGCIQLNWLLPEMRSESAHPESDRNGFHKNCKGTGRLPTF